MSTPFGDEDVNQDVKTRVANRQVQWGYLQDTGASPMGKPRSSSANDQPLMMDTFLVAEDFIRRLLEYDPRKRMSLTDARDHPWLAAQRAAQAAAAPPAPAPSAPARPAAISSQRHDLVDASMRSVISNGMSLDDAMETGRMTPPYVPEPADDETAPSQSLTNALERLPSRLVRRSNYIQRARDRGDDLPSPSQEMRLRAAAEEEAENANGPPNSRSNKRKAALDFEASLTPMDEEDENDAGAIASEEPAPAGARGTKTKRGRGGGAKKAVVGAGAAPPPSKRGRGRSAATATSNGDESETGGLRRSSRLNQGSPVKATKVARRG